VKSDLKERIIKMRCRSELKLRDTLELLLREEEEWQALVIYRRDFRFHGKEGDEKAYKLELDRTIIVMLHCPMRMHEKVLTLLYSEVLNGKKKREVQVGRRRKTNIAPVLGEAAVIYFYLLEVNTGFCRSSLFQTCLETFFHTLNRYLSCNLFIIKTGIIYSCVSPLPSTARVDKQAVPVLSLLRVLLAYDLPHQHPYIHTCLTHEDKPCLGKII
jgi:hypothetical protein